MGLFATTFPAVLVLPNWTLPDFSHLAGVSSDTKCSDAIVCDLHHAAVVVYHQECAGQTTRASANVLTS